jgi:hypothetical protein
MTRALLLVLVLACGGKQHTDTDPVPGGGSATPVAHDTRTPLEQRRDAACEQVQPRLTDCAVEDAKREVERGRMTKAEFDKLKPEELRGAHKQKFLKECKGASMSSRQVRVLEVCYREEKDCDPLAECLKNLEPSK